MLEVKCSNGRMEFSVDGNMEQIGKELLTLCNGVLDEMYKQNQTDSIILRVWLYKNLMLGLRVVQMDGEAHQK